MGWTDTVHKFLAHLKYNSTLPTYTNGSTAEAQCDDRGRLLVSIAGYSGAPSSSSSGTEWAHALASASSGTIAATAKTLHFAVFTSEYGLPGYIQLHNLAAHGSLVSTTSVPYMAPIPIAANGFAVLELPRGLLFGTGIVWAYSTTLNVYTADTNAQVVLSAEIS